MFFFFKPSGKTSRRQLLPPRPHAPTRVHVHTRTLSSILFGRNPALTLTVTTHVELPEATKHELCIGKRSFYSCIFFLLFILSSMSTHTRVSRTAQHSLVAASGFHQYFHQAARRLPTSRALAFWRGENSIWISSRIREWPWRPVFFGGANAEWILLSSHGLRSRGDSLFNKLHLMWSMKRDQMSLKAGGISGCW